MREHDDEMDQYFGHLRKEKKIERKIASSTDRSKYKKTDQEKYLKSLEEEKKSKLFHKDLLKGRVLSVLPQDILVEDEADKTILRCVLKGLLKKEKTQLKNLVVVGDIVRFEKTTTEEGIISHIEPRKTVLSRADNLSRRKEQLIAANIDQVFITVSVARPALNPFIVDRYIIATRIGGMEPVVLINKIDLLVNSEEDPIIREQQQLLFQEFLDVYKKEGICIIPLSTVTKEGLDVLQQQMKNKTSVFSGQSGVGKSSIINSLTGMNLKVREIVEKTNKGAHTTTTACLIPLERGGWCIDTPGIKSFGVWDLKEEDVQSYFSEIKREGKKCKYPDCSHTHEEDCAVRMAIEAGDISALRYDSYVALLQSIQTEHKRR